MGSTNVLSVGKRVAKALHWMVPRLCLTSFILFNSLSQFEAHMTWVSKSTQKIKNNYYAQTHYKRCFSAKDSVKKQALKNTPADTAIFRHHTKRIRNG